MLETKPSKETIHQQVQDYYGKQLQTGADLQTDACCTPDLIPDFAKQLLAEIHPEVLAKYYGCGLVLPNCLDGLKVLDLGCGAGRDCYVLSRLVGEHGSVVGVDMTDEQLAVANSHQEYHRKQFGYQHSNVEFLKGNIEQLDDLGLQPESFDLVVSNCVINLVSDKAKVLSDIHRLLKTGGEMYFSDVYCDRRLPQTLQNHPVLYGECLAGALYWNDFLNLSKAAGFLDPRLMESRPLGIGKAEIQQKLGNSRFYSATYRLFKLAELEPACEDFGQAVRYLGSIPHAETHFELDDHHHIETGRIFPVCGNTWRMLHDSRFNPHFEFIGDWTTHFGIFPGCGTSIPFQVEPAPGQETSGGCC